jgi:hypothetical protein
LATKSTRPTAEPATRSTASSAPATELEIALKRHDQLNLGLQRRILIGGSAQLRLQILHHATPGTTEPARSASRPAKSARSASLSESAGSASLATESTTRPAKSTRPAATGPTARAATRSTITGSTGRLAKRQARQHQCGKDRRPDQFSILHAIPFIDRAIHPSREKLPASPIAEIAQIFPAAVWLSLRGAG